MVRKDLIEDMLSKGTNKKLKLSNKVIDNLLNKYKTCFFLYFIMMTN